VCRDWYQVISRLFSRGGKFANHLLTLLKLFPNKDWDYWELSSNTCIRWSYIRDNHKKGWNWDAVAKNPGIQWHDIMDDPVLSLVVVLQQKRMQFSKCISRNPNITWDNVITSNFKWNYKQLIKNPNITWENIQSHPHLRKVNPSGNPNITVEIIKAHPEINWDFKLLSKNTNITWEFIEETMYRGWDFIELSKHPNVTIENVENNINLSWRADGLCENPNITWEIVLNNFFKYNWVWEMLSINPSISWKEIIENQDHWWSWNFVLTRPDAPFPDIVFNSPIKDVNEYKRVWSCISLNPQLTWEIVYNNPGLGWNWGLISSNCFQI
jgi:hypothetical protein